MCVQYITLHVCGSLGLDVREVAHDYQPTIKNYLEKELKCVKFDTWHGKDNNIMLTMVCVHIYIYIICILHWRYHLFCLRKERKMLHES